jgi:glycosyltransferase involved in cell wall biosynthesis
MNEERSANGNAKRYASHKLRLGISWQVSTTTGWGIYGLNLTLHCMLRGGPLPVLFTSPDLRGINVLQEHLLLPAISLQQQLSAHIQKNPGQPLNLDFTIIHGLGNDMHGRNMSGKRNVGAIFFENTYFSNEGLERARSFDLIVAGSTWNQEVLRSLGLTNVTVSLQGIDPTVFHPAPRVGWLRDRFIIFSGGKLEYRKGQDIVIAAFREFRRKHPEALLMVAWHNYWPQTIMEIASSKHVQGVPNIGNNGALDIKGWLLRNDVPPDAVIDIGLIANTQMGGLLREANVGLFTNRCEGGTNLVAMECMACGVPTIVSANTGHLDLLNLGGCFPIREQGAVKPTPQFQGVEGWGESSVEETLSLLEYVYDNYSEASKQAQQGSEAMLRLSWENQIENLIETIGDLL